MVKETDDFVSELERQVFDKVKPYFVERQRKKFSDYLKRLLKFNPAQVKSLVEDYESAGEDESVAINTAYTPLVEDYVELCLCDILDRTPRSARFVREDLDAVWKTYTSARYSKQQGVTTKDAELLVEAIKDVLLEGKLDFPVKIDSDEKWYEVRRENKELEVIRL